MSSYLFNIFGQSPIRPLQEHIAKAYEAASLLKDFFAAIIAADYELASQLQLKIVQLEHEADVIKKNIRLHVPQHLFMPIARPDLLELLKFQDDIANRAKDISGLVIGRKMQVPELLSSVFMNFLSRCIVACGQAHKTICELDELVATGFKGAEVEMVQSMIKTLDDIENETDMLQVKVRAALFAIEKSLPPIDVMFLYKVIEWTGGLADLAQSVGHRLERMLAR